MLYKILYLFLFIFTGLFVYLSGCRRLLILLVTEHIVRAQLEKQRIDIKLFFITCVVLFLCILWNVGSVYFVEYGLSIFNISKLS